MYPTPCKEAPAAAAKASTAPKGKAKSQASTKQKAKSKAKAKAKASEKPKAKPKAKGKAGAKKAKVKEEEHGEEAAEVDTPPAPAGSKIKMKRPAAAAEPDAAEGPRFGFQVCSKIAKIHVLDFVWLLGGTKKGKTNKSESKEVAKLSKIYTYKKQNRVCFKMDGREVCATKLNNCHSCWGCHVMWILRHLLKFGL